MAIQIGQPALPTFNEPLALLMDCHRRIEQFLEVLLLVTDQARGGPLSSTQREAMETALRYFREGAPRHTQDEEISLFPRMRELSGAQREALHPALEQMAALEQDHRRAEAAHGEVEKLAQTWLTHQQLNAADTERLSFLLRELRQTYASHIRLEDEQIFPLAGRLLDDKTLKAIGAEMAARRGQALPPTAPQKA